MKIRYCFWIIHFVLFVGGWTWVQAQNELFSRQYFLNNYLVNPAVAGIFDYGDMRLEYCRQWAGIEHSPSSLVFTFHTNLSRQKGQVLRYSYPERRYIKGQRGLQRYDRHLRHGVGVRLVYDRVHVFTNTGAVLSYACHVPLSSAWTLSVGLSAGGVHSGISLGDSYIVDSGDPLLQQGRKELIPLVEAGCWFYSSAFYLGASVSKLMSNPYDTDKTNKPDVYATLGYQLRTSPGGDRTVGDVSAE